MKYFILFLLLLLTSCSPSEITKTDEADFVETVQYYQDLYTAGSKNCDEILSMIDKNVDFNENGKNWTKAELEEFCPHLPEKNVVKTISDHKLLNSNLGYHFVNQLILTSKQDTVSETTSSVWEKKNKTWKIIKMDAVRYIVVE